VRFAGLRYVGCGPGWRRGGGIGEKERKREGERERRKRLKVKTNTYGASAGRERTKRERERRRERKEKEKERNKQTNKQKRTIGPFPPQVLAGIHVMSGFHLLIVYFIFGPNTDIALSRVPT